MPKAIYIWSPTMKLNQGNIEVIIYKEGRQVKLKQ
jgi:hypothetical protein